MGAKNHQQIKKVLTDSPINISLHSFIEEILKIAAQRGNCCIKLEELVSAASKTATPLAVKKTITQMAMREQIIVTQMEGKYLCYLPSLWSCEQRVASNILKRLASPLPISEQTVSTLIQQYCKEKELKLHPNQEQAVRMAAVEKLAIMTGGPGCGKTFTASAILSVWKKLGKKVVLCAPTGRASAKLAEGTGEEAKTIHKLLEYSRQGFKRNASNPIDADAILIDESSMVDIQLMLALLEALKPSAQILFVGDVNQLPSVGPGKVLHDLIDSKKIPLTKLTATFRQGAESKIITVADAINEGRYPEIERVTRGRIPDTDCFLIEAETPEEGLDIIADLLSKFIPEMNYNPAKDVQILCPMKKGQIGTIAVNAELRDIFNPPSVDKNEIRVGTIHFRVGEKVIQTKNRTEVKNGDVGTIESISNGKIVVKYIKDTRVEYSKQDISQLLPAWAISVHRSQGSDYPVAIVPMFDESQRMMNRNLLYTAVTRAKRIAIIIGSKNAIAMAAKTDGVVRMTTLRQRLAA